MTQMTFDALMTVIEHLVEQKTLTGPVLSSMEMLRERRKSGLPFDVTTPMTNFKKEQQQS